MNNFIPRPLPLIRSYHIGDPRTDISNDLYKFNNEKSEEMLNKLNEYDPELLLSTIKENYFIFNEESLKILNDNFHTDEMLINDVMYDDQPLYKIVINKILPRLSTNDIRYYLSILPYYSPFRNIFQDIIDDEERMNEFLKYNNLDSNLTNMILSYVTPRLSVSEDYGNFQKDLQGYVREKTPKKKKSKRKNKKKKSRHNSALRRF